MQSHDLFPNPTLISPNPQLLDPSTMNDAVSSPIHLTPDEPKNNGDAQKPETNDNPETKEKNPIDGESNKELGSENISSKSSKNDKKERNNSDSSNNHVIVRRERPTRACTARPIKYVDPPVIERRPRLAKREKVVVEEVEEEEEEEEESKEQCSKVVTSLVNAPTLEQMPRWNLRSMWELASILNFLHGFRPLLNITVEFSAEELETALLTPNSTLGDIHIPLLKAIPPVTRMASGRDTWVTVLCRKMRDWWHWVAEGELPIVASHGAEIEAYKTLDPGVRVVILKALCDIRVEQDDIRSYIDDSLKHGVQLSAFRKERIGGDSHGCSYWYEDDEIIGHRLYREMRKVEKLEVKKGKTKGSLVLPSTSYNWETVATNLDEFLDVSEKLFSSKNRTEASLGKKLKNDKLPEIEKIHKRKEKLLKKQQRQALLLDNYVTMDGLAAGRSLRGRKPVTYTFDDFDRSINEAIKITKRKQPSPEPTVRREGAKSEPSANGRWNGSSHASLNVSFSPPSPIDYDELDEDHNESQLLDRSNRRRQRPQRYSEREFVEAVSENEEDFASDDDIVGEAVYDEDYLRKLKHKKKLTSSSEGEGDEEYHWSEENGEDEVEEEEEDEDSLSLSEDSDQPRTRRFNRSECGTRIGATKSRSVDGLQTGLRRSNRATRNQINYQQYELSESENESMKNGNGIAEEHERHSDNATDNEEDYSMESRDSEGNDEDQETGFDPPAIMDVGKGENRFPMKSESPKQDDEDDGVGKRRFLDLNELAPGSGFEEGPNALVKDDDDDDDVKGE